MERHVRKSEKIVGGEKRGGVVVVVNVLGGERREGGRRLRLGRVAQQIGRVRVVRERREGAQGGRGGEEVKGWKNVGILQQSGWCEGGRVRNVAGNARASSVCKKPHCNISHP